jgi:hypothetical protein
MSKLEDKLNASIKPGRAPAADKPSAKAAPAAKPAAKPAAANAAETDLNAAAQPLHPTRIWPD